MSRIFLNELKATDRQLPVPEAGKWKNDPAFLQRFSHDIYVKGEVSDRAVNSVPSVFARPIQFSQALALDTHPMHKAVVGQWRGLLAMFALQRALQIPLRVSRFEVRDETKEEDLDRRFVQILNSQLPYPAEEWKSWLLIYCNDQLVGATSPWTMVYTPTEYRVLSGVSWVDSSGQLIDPFKALYDTNGNNEELGVLLTWIDRLMASHPWGMSKDRETQSGVIKRELVVWRTELGRMVQSYQDTAPLDTPFAQAVGPYGAFLSSLGVRPFAETVASDLEIDDTEGSGSVVLSRTAFTNAAVAKLRVLGSVRAEHVDVSRAALPKSSGEAGWRTKTGVAVPRPYLIAEEYFLSEKLLALPLSAAARSAGTTEYALPLMPAFFKHFAPKRLDDDLLSVTASVDGVTVRLRVPLKGGRRLEVERRYLPSDIERIPDGQHTPALAVWPDFYDPDWRDYDALLADAGAHSSTRLRFAPFREGGDTDAAIALSEEDGSLAIWRESQPVLGFAVEIVDAGSKPVGAGVVVRRSTVAPQQRGGTWDVGIDFGTSNTQIKVLMPDGGEKPLQLSSHLLMLTKATKGSEDRLHEIHPAAAVVPPFATLLKKESLLVISGSAASHETVGVIPLALNTVTLAKGSAEFVRDLKWSADEDAQKRYLEALARLVCAEADAAGVEHLILRWSYPLSLPAAIRSTMERFWNSIGSERSGDGIKVETTAGASESDAVSRYVSGKNLLPIAADSLSVGVDVGGGSTDAAYWAGNILIDRVSLNVAANDIIRFAASFGELNRRLLVAGGRTADDMTSEDYKVAFDQRPEIVWNALLLNLGLTNSRSGALPHAHPFVTQMNMTNNAEWRKCRTGAYLILGGICFYLGVQASANVTQALSAVAIYLGGRGSSLFSWIAPPAKIGQMVAQHFLRGLQLINPDAKPQIEVSGPVVGKQKSALLKDEVAGGLIARQELAAATRAGFDLSKTIVGEAHWTDSAGREVQWNDPVDTGGIRGLKPPANHNSSFIAYYLTQVARPAAEGLDLDLDGLAGIDLNQSWAVHDMRTRYDEYVLQPVFAYELKSLIAKYAEEAVART